MKVILESPFSGNIEENLEYARRCMRDCFLRGEYPFASHLLYTQEGVLDDNIPEERWVGIDAGLEWGKHADKTVVYIDLGISKGMNYGINYALKIGRPVEYRSLSHPEEKVNHKKTFVPYSENKVWCKICYVDAIIKNNFNGHSIKKHLNDLVSEMRRMEWDEDMIYDFLVKEVEPEAKTVKFLNSIVGYIYGWKNGVKENNF